MKKIVSIVGARPQFVKAAVVSRAIQKQPALQEVLVHTGQHYDDNMSKVFLDELDMPPIDYPLSVSTTSHGAQTAEMLDKVEKVLLKEKPDAVLIYGDTNSTLAGTLAAVKLHIPVAHVEAGLRSYNRVMPEEINRIVADQLSRILFAPTSQAVLNLKKEGIADNHIFEVGDVMFDAALFYADKADKLSASLVTLGCKRGQYVLATLHRAENTDHPERLGQLFGALEYVSRDMPVILPLHPRTRQRLQQAHPAILKHSAIRLIDPVGFLDMVMLEKNAALIVTDSGGVQKEAFFYQIPCVTLRQETEWVETVELGWNRLMREIEASSIAALIQSALGTSGQTGHTPYGLGNTADRVADCLAQEI